MIFCWNRALFFELKTKSMKTIVALLCILLSASLLTAQSPVDLPSGNSGLNQEGSLRQFGVFRDYLVHLPAGYSERKKYPLVVNLHGMGGNMRRQMEYTDMNAVADEEKFIVVYPQGLTGKVPARGETTQWDTHFNTNTRDVEFMDTLLQVLEENYSIDSRRVYATGFSNGALMCYRLACELPGRFAAIAPVGGNMPLAQELQCALDPPVSVLYMHGNEDRIMPINGIPLYSMSAEATVQFFRDRNGCSGDPYQFSVPDVDTEDRSTVRILTFADCEGKSTVVHYLINGGGHTWPGAQEDKRLGNTNRDIQASRIIWEFFAEHRLPKIK